MRAFLDLIKTTVLGGVVFLVPAVLVVVVVQKALSLARPGIAPIARALPYESVGGIALATLLGGLLLLAVCFGAGLVARTGAGRLFTSWVEETFLGNLLGYRAFKSMAQGLVAVETTPELTVALARIEDAWQLAFILEEHDNGLLTVFVPQAPTPMSGSVYYLSTDRVKRLDVPVSRALLCIKRLGLGSKQLLSGQL
ncbi:MAG: DUF502 domain-containing protein [Candidatus Binatia bacterium]